jgi:hypothetical protein
VLLYCFYREDVTLPKTYGRTSITVVHTLSLPREANKENKKM